MKITDSLRKAYETENLPGSYLTSPLRSWNAGCQKNIDACPQDSCKRTAWKVAHFIFTFFIFPILGTFALAGIAVNLFKTAKEEEQSIQVVQQQPPAPLQQDVEAFCSRLKEDITSMARSNILETREREYSHDSHGYTYRKLQDIFFRFIAHDGVSDAQANEQWTKHTEDILEKIRDACRRFSFIPEKYTVRINNQYKYHVVSCSIPDHVPLKGCLLNRIGDEHR